MHKLNFSPLAVQDLQEIKNYITLELASPLAAQNTLQKILHRLTRLQNYPRSGALLSAIIRINTDYRYLVCENYLAFYRYENKNIYITRILHSKRDFLTVLFGGTL